MTPRLRKLTLTTHIILSVGWLGAAAAYLALAVAALTSRDPQIVRAAYIVMEPIARLAIVPLAFSALLTGLVMSLGTRWGLFRYYWVLFKLLLTIFAAIVLLEHMSTVSSLGNAAVATGRVDPGGLKGEILHAGGGLLVLIVVAVLGIYKPKGKIPTLSGRRNEDIRTESDPTSTERPRWATIFGIVIFILILLFVILHLAGGGPGSH